MTAFPEWLGAMGLAHCRPILLAHGIDFDTAAHLSEDDLCRLGLDADDSQRLRQALAVRGQSAAVLSAEVESVLTTSSRPTLAFVGELRQLTVMFCDLVGYTGLSQRLGHQKKLERLAQLRHAYVSTCDKIVAKYKGEVKQVEGDGLMAYFGLPAAGNDAERGVRAALEIVQAIKELRTGEPLAVRIGVATGPVVVGAPCGTGSIGAGLAVGETPNLAKRFQSKAGVNQIVIADDTRRLLGETFDLADLGGLSLDGIDGLLRAWRVEGARRDDGRFRAAHGGAPLTALVGRKRQKDVELLLHEWQLARGGTGRAAVIRGDAGIGKSRLAEELLQNITGHAQTTLRYQCSPFHLNAAMYPFIAQIELAAGFAREDTADQKLDKLERILVGSDVESAPLLAALLSLPTARYSPLGLSAQRQKEKTLEVLLDQIEAPSRSDPVVPVLMVVEDVHWIDPTSQELLDALVPRLAALSIMLMLTYRSDAEQPYTPSWIHSAHVTTIALEGLAHHEVAELAGNVAGGKALPDEVLEQLVLRSDGVPLFIEELTKLHLESGLLFEEADRYTLREPLPALSIPTKLNEFLIERLDRYKWAKELAQIGSCIGRVFSYELLAAVSARKGRELDDELEQLTRTELVFRQGTPPDATYAFKHALVRDAAYDSLLDSQRQALHERIADVLEREFKQSVANEPELLAHHRTEAGQLVAAIRLWRRAGESALAGVALKEAVAYLEKGLAIVDQLAPSAERDGLELSLREPLHSARQRWQSWSSPGVGVNAAAILRLAERERRPESLLVGLWGMWINTITRGRVAKSRHWADRLLDEGTKDGNIDLQILGHRASLSSHFYLGELHEAQRQGKRVLELYDPSLATRWMELSGGNDVRTAAGVFSSQCLWMQGYPDSAVRVSDQKDADVRELGRPFDIAWALTWGAYVFDYRCEPEQLLKRVDEADRIGREQSIPLFCNVLVPIGEGLARLRIGQLSESVSSLRRGIGGWIARGGHLNVPYLKSALAEALARQGDLDTALRLIDECLDQIERPEWQERVWRPEVLRLKGWMLMRQGKLAEAEAQLQVSLQVARDQHARSWELRSSTTLAELLIERGRRDDARHQLTPVYDRFTEGFDTRDLKAARALLEDLR